MTFKTDDENPIYFRSLVHSKDYKVWVLIRSDEKLPNDPVLWNFPFRTNLNASWYVSNYTTYNYIYIPTVSIDLNSENSSSPFCPIAFFYTSSSPPAILTTGIIACEVLLFEFKSQKCDQWEASFLCL